MTKEYDATKLLALLQEYRSEEARRARRNVVVTSFIIVVAWLVDAEISDVNALGVEVPPDAEVSVLWVGVLLLTYWMVMFHLTAKHEREVQKERQELLDSEIKPIMDRYARNEKARSADPGRYIHDYGEVAGFVKAYEAQAKRTKTASDLNRIIGKLELYLPWVLSALAQLILVWSLVVASCDNPWSEPRYCLLV